MIEIDIPGYGDLKLKHLVLDYNGTLAVDGFIEKDVVGMLNKLSDRLTLHIITADTFGRARHELTGVNSHLKILKSACEQEAKLSFIQKLDYKAVVSIGNGRNDKLMLKHSALGIAVILSEGVAVETIKAADVVCKSIIFALELLLYPQRLLATLRS